ncbi:uncharacterized protein PAC_15837 [Phialocephala subalpina]|uniref:Uncharacterized protein n=1 Tax=Phialocephala subalpina TaxID=576137 RepID=A0A1L7XLW8_9HELO|nr:uncharacterized protein PAC_15837 [Phialocephala subalpina]
MNALIGSSSFPAVEQSSSYQAVLVDNVILLVTFVDETQSLTNNHDFDSYSENGDSPAAVPEDTPISTSTSHFTHNEASHSPFSDQQRRTYTSSISAFMGPFKPSYPRASPPSITPKTTWPSSSSLLAITFTYFIHTNHTS